MTRLALYGLTLCLTACGRQAGPDLTPVDPPSPPGTAIRVRPVGDHDQVDLAVGQTLALQMQSHFEWREAAAPTLLRRDDILWGPVDQVAASSNSWQVFVYRAVEPAEETLSLIEARPWEPDRISDRYALTVRVRAQVESPRTPKPPRNRQGNRQAEPSNPTAGT